MPNVLFFHILGIWNLKLYIVGPFGTCLFHSKNKWESFCPFLTLAMSVGSFQEFQYFLAGLSSWHCYFNLTWNSDHISSRGWKPRKFSCICDNWYCIATSNLAISITQSKVMAFPSMVILVHILSSVIPVITLSLSILCFMALVGNSASSMSILALVWHLSKVMDPCHKHLSSTTAIRPFDLDVMCCLNNVQWLSNFFFNLWWVFHALSTFPLNQHLYLSTSRLGNSIVWWHAHCNIRDDEAESEIFSWLMCVW